MPTLLAAYPEEYFARFPMPHRFVNMVVGRLRLDDVYNQIGHYPSPGGAVQGESSVTQ